MIVLFLLWFDLIYKNAPEAESNRYALRRLQDLKSWLLTRASHQSKHLSHNPLNYTYRQDKGGQDYKNTRQQDYYTTT